MQDASDILCTKVTSWKDAITDCLHEGGRPLTHKEISTTNFSEKINMTVWTADYATVSYNSGSANIGNVIIVFRFLMRQKYDVSRYSGDWSIMS